jgi:mRNA interferase YafQ
MYKIVTIPEFDKLFVKITKNNSLLKIKIIACIEKLAQDPFYPSLRSHKVDTKKYNEVWSSSINGDWRIVWAFVCSLALIQDQIKFITTKANTWNSYQGVIFLAQNYL